MAATVISGASSGAALAHGPCGCLEPRLTEEGRHVRIVGRYPAYRVIFNPGAKDFGIAPPYLASAYRADVPTTTVLSRPRRDPIREARFDVPKRTPPGLYLVLIFDGTEGGNHNTWEYLHVTELDKHDEEGVVAWQSASPAPLGASGQAPRQLDRSDTYSPWLLLVAAALGGVAVGAVVGARIGKRRT